MDDEGNVLGAEFLSFEEYAELVARHGGKLEVPEVLYPVATAPERPAVFRWGPGTDC